MNLHKYSLVVYKQLLSFTLLYLILLSPNYGQRTVTGKVVDEHGHGLISATVEAFIYTSDSNHKHTTVSTLTDIHGNYSIDIPYSKLYKLRILYTGYRDNAVILGTDQNQLDFKIPDGTSDCEDELIYIFDIDTAKTKIKGTLVNMKGQPLVKARILLLKKDKTDNYLIEPYLYLYTDTDENGEFKLKIKEVGRYILIVKGEYEGLSGEKIEWSFSNKRYVGLKIYAKGTGSGCTYVKPSAIGIQKIWHIKPEDFFEGYQDVLIGIW